VSKDTDVHLKIDIVAGRDEDIEKFLFMCHHLDPDWPLWGQWDKAVKRRICTKCGGRLYQNPALGPQDIKAAARQCGVNVKIRQFAPCARCFPGMETEHYMLEPLLTKEEISNDNGHRTGLAQQAAISTSAGAGHVYVN
jgi:hypothetical protein